MPNANDLERCCSRHQPESQQLEEEVEVKCGGCDRPLGFRVPRKMIARMAITCGHCAVTTPAEIAE